MPIKLLQLTIDDSDGLLGEGVREKLVAATGESHYIVGIGPNDACPSVLRGYSFGLLGISRNAGLQAKIRSTKARASHLYMTCYT